MVSIHPTIRYLYHLLVRVAGELETIPADLGQGTPWAGRQTITSLTQGQITIHIHTDGKYRVGN